MPGHVFLVHANLTRLACDAWLVPSGSKPGPGMVWKDSVSSAVPAGTPAHWRVSSGRVIRWDPIQPDWPRPWVVKTHSGGDAPADKFVDAARQFLEVTSAESGSPRGGRAAPLLALPVVGAGSAGGGHKAGEIVRELLPALYEFVKSKRVDVALVMKDAAQYAAAQAVRLQLMGEGAWPELSDDMRGRADELAGLALCRKLVLFLGAGVSQSAGLPSWGDLLADLAGQELAADPQFGKLGALDQARLIRTRLPADVRLGQAVADRIQSHHYSLAHGLLAALPVNEVVTTNYDTLFEEASRAIRREVDVLPYDPVAGDRRWLLKLHGCVTHPDDIVLTREDYLRYDAGRAALAGLVQGLLITRHMLFVGFSLGDDNFHRIADAVRRAVRREPFGTSLSVAGNRLLQEIWAKDLSWVEFGGLPESPRLLEIFLDRLAARSAATADHLFDTKYDATLTASEKSLRHELDRLADFIAHVPATERQGAAWTEVMALYARLGRPIRGDEGLV